MFLKHVKFGDLLLNCYIRNNILKIKFSIILFLVIYSIQFVQQISLKEREILQLQDQRSLSNGKLVSYLKDNDARLRYRAAIALANIQDSSVVEALVISLKDNDVIVREASAFALGQIGTEQAVNELLSAALTEDNENVLARILEAMGKSGSQGILDSLLNYDAYLPMKYPSKHLALSIARFAIRGIKTERSIWKCFELAKAESSEVRSAALLALWRSAPNGLIDLEISKQKEELIQLARDKNSDVRMQLATLLGRSKPKDSNEILDTLEQTEANLNDWRVWVQIVRARAAISTADKEMFINYPQYFTSKNDHIKIAALQAFIAMSSILITQSEIADSMRQIMLKMASDSLDEIDVVRGEALVALGKHFPEELNRFLFWLNDKQVTPRMKAKLLEGLGQQVTRQSLDILLANLDHKSTRVAMAALDFIKRMLSPIAMKSYSLDSTEEKTLLNSVFRKAVIALKKEDIGVTTLVANLFNDTAVLKSFKAYKFDGQIVDEMIIAYKAIVQPDNSNAKQAILQALGSIKDTGSVSFLEKVLLDSDHVVATEAAASLRRITGKDYSNQLQKQVIPIRTEEDWKLLENILPEQLVRLKTNRGEIILELQKEQAPFTVLNFVKLIKKGFYNGLCFHRVVPDFVAQGGDPRGDGWGGPGYTMRTEVSLASFDAGTCGMASAGRDTEGCQFFITHIAAPHLDGRYTIFAKIVKGMDAVNRIQIDDVIQEVQLMR